MIRTGLRSAIFAAILVLLSLTVPSVRSDSDELGGKFVFPNASNTYVNPCAGNAAVTGSVTFTAVVRADDQGGGRGSVSVSAVFVGSATDTANNSLTIRGSAQAFYNTLSDHYVLPTVLDYDATNNPAMSFRALTDTTVFVDMATQKPFNFGNVGLKQSCDHK
jgi:hypothetical protein